MDYPDIRTAITMTKVDLSKLSLSDLTALMADVKAREAEAKKAERAAKKNERDPVPEAFASLAGHVCTVTGGRKFPEGTQINITKVGMSRYNTPYARGYKGDLEVFIDPKWLKKGKAVDDVKLALYASKQDATIRFRGVARHETDKAVSIRPDALFQSIFFAKSNVALIREEDDDRSVYEAPEWAVRNKIGQPGVDILRADSEARGLDAIE